MRRAVLAMLPTTSGAAQPCGIMRAQATHTTRRAAAAAAATASTTPAAPAPAAAAGATAAATAAATDAATAAAAHPAIPACAATASTRALASSKPALAANLSKLDDEKFRALVGHSDNASHLKSSANLHYWSALA